MFKFSLNSNKYLHDSSEMHTMQLKNIDLCELWKRRLLQ